MKENKVYNVLIIGAGDIGSGYDSPNSLNYLTHAHAFSDHKGFNLVGFVEPNLELAKLASTKWETSYFLTLEEAFQCTESIDIVSVAAPDELHYSILKKVATYNPKFVLAEKPLTLSLNEAKEIVKLYKNVPAIVNFKRKFVPEIIELKNRIANNNYGKFIYGSSYYGKGFNHNGCHLINLIFCLLDNKWDYLISLDKIYDYKSTDPSYSLLLKDGDNASFLIKAVDQNNFGVFEIDLLFEKGRVRITDTGFKIEEYCVNKSELFPAFKTINKIEEYNTQLNNSLLLTVDHMYKYLVDKCDLLCSFEEVYKEMGFMNQIINKIENDKTGNTGWELN